MGTVISLFYVWTYPSLYPSGLVNFLRLGLGDKSKFIITGDLLSLVMKY